MRLQLYEVQVLVGGLLAGLMESLVVIQPPWLNASAVELLEAGSFLFCCAGVLTGGRAIRTAFDAFGRDKKAATRDAAYMRARTRFRVVSFIAIAAVGLLVARRFNINAAYALVGAALLGMAVPMIDRASGWVPDRSDAS